MEDFRLQWKHMLVMEKKEESLKKYPLLTLTVFSISIKYAQTYDEFLEHIAQFL